MKINSSFIIIQTRREFVWFMYEIGKVRDVFSPKSGRQNYQVVALRDFAFNLNYFHYKNSLSVGSVWSEFSFKIELRH